MRPPYGRENVTVPSTCFFVGTTNKKDLLNDPIGDRGYGVLGVLTDFIPYERLDTERDLMQGSSGETLPSWGTLGLVTTASSVCAYTRSLGNASLARIAPTLWKLISNFFEIHKLFICPKYWAKSLRKL